MATGTPPPVIHIELKFYYGAKGIASLLGCSIHTARRLIRENKLPVKKDILGRWVLTNHDWLLSMQD